MEQDVVTVFVDVDETPDGYMFDAVEGFGLVVSSSEPVGGNEWEITVLGDDLALERMWRWMAGELVEDLVEEVRS